MNFTEIVTKAASQASKNTTLLTISRASANFILQGYELSQQEKRNIIFELGRRLRSEVTSATVKSKVRNLVKIGANGVVTGVISGYIGDKPGAIRLHKDYADIATKLGEPVGSFLTKVRQGLATTKKFYMEDIANKLNNLDELIAPYIETKLAETIEGWITAGVTSKAELEYNLEGEHNGTPDYADIVHLESEESPSMLETILNKLRSLPEQVAEDMLDGSIPGGLKYRTGRFARSTTATRVSFEEHQGLSIDYTYMLYPYQTFEPGYAMGSVTRDPRRLIEHSIRTLMAGIFIDRMNLTRVETGKQPGFTEWV